MRGSLAVIVASESAVIVAGGHFVGLPGLVLVLIATAAWALVVFGRHDEARPRDVAIAIGALFAVAVAVAPHGSHDVWSYVMSGRIVDAHHTNPYVHPPSDFPGDPFVQYVGAGWRHTTSVYGPLFTAVSAGFTHVAGGSALRARLAFQGLAALSVVTALALIWRETHSSRAVAFVGLHPVTAATIVNGAHNDGLVGLAVLTAVLLVARRRWCAAGFVLGLGILCKASGALGLLGIVAWTLRRDRKGAAIMVLVAFAATVVGYVPFGATATSGLLGADKGNTRASPWDFIRTVAHPPSRMLAVVVLGLVVVAAWRWRTASRPGTAATAPMAAYLVGGAYVLPWYSAWALPTAALARQSFLAVLVATHAAFLVAVYELELPAHTSLTGMGAVARTVVIVTCASGFLAAFVIRLVCAPATEDQPWMPGFPLRP